MAKVVYTPETAMMRALQAAYHSPAPRRKVGCAIWRPTGILATTCNAPPNGVPNCKDGGCWEVEGACRRNCHSEVYAIALCARNGISTNGAFVCVTEQPCIDCAREMKIAGIQEVWYWRPSDYPRAYYGDMPAHYDNVGLLSRTLARPDGTYATELLEFEKQLKNTLKKDLAKGG